MYLFRIHFGDKNIEPFKIINGIIKDIFIASEMLSHLWQKLGKRTLTPEAIQKNSEDIKKTAIFFGIPVKMMKLY
jgi:hypothetical protein